VKRVRIMLAAAVLLVAALAAPAAAQEAGTVTVVHGVPGLTVDVYVNGDATLEGFEPGTVTDPLELPAGTYDIEIYPAGADASSEDPAISGSVDLPAGANASLVAHLGESGEPTLTPFVNDTSEVAAGEARLTVRHTAAAPAVDVLAGDAPVFEGLTNPNEASASVPAGTVSAAVALAGTTDPVLGPAELTLEEGTSTIVYAIGSAEEGSLDLLVQSISGLHSAPSGVDSGTGGQADTGSSQLAIAGLVLGLSGLTFGGYALRRAHR
jgi:Domain of unknown function (DUF4397)